MSNSDKLQMQAGKAKKPRLDVPSTVAADEELWGEDFAAEDLDECFLLASQMCTDIQPEKSNVHDQQVQSVLQARATDQQHQVNSLPSTQNQENIPTFYQPNQNTAQTAHLHQSVNISTGNNLNHKQPVPGQSITSQNRSSNLNSNQEIHVLEVNYMKSDLKKLCEENKKCKDSLLTKEGEVSNLRRQLKQSEVKLNMQLELKAREYEDKLRVMKKELDIAKTSLELQKLAAWKESDRLLLLSTSQNVEEEIKQHRDICNEMLDFKAIALESNGSILNHLLNPHLFGKSDLEIHEVKLESKFSLQVSTTNRKRASWRPSLYPYRLSVESSWSLANQLGLQDSFETIISKRYMEEIFVECRAVLYGLLLTLRERGNEETPQLLLDHQDRQLQGSPVHALEDPVLLSNKMWYEVERGLEARRALGLLSAICTLSEHMSTIMYGFPNKPTNSESEAADIESCKASNRLPIANFAIVETIQSVTPKRIRLELISQDNVHKGRSVLVNEDGQIAFQKNHTHKSKKCEQEMDKEKELKLKYEIKEIGFLNLLKNITNIIYNQKNSFEYSGFLTSMVSLLRSSLCKGSIPASGNQVVGDIIRDVVFSRPRVETVVALSELLYSLSSNIQVMETLCHGQEIRASSLSFCKTNPCVIQVLCGLLELSNTNVVSRTRLHHSVINWVWACIKQRPHRGPKWAQCPPGKASGSCSCRARLAEVTIKLIYQTYKDYEVNALTKLGESLRKALVHGIVLLHQLTETDAEFFIYMQEAEGCYQWLLIGLRNTPHDLCLDQDEGDALRELLAMEDATEPHSFNETKKTEHHLQEICTSMKSCWATQSISHQVGTDILEGD